MNKKWINVVVIAITCLTLSVGAAIAAGTPGSEDDPVVTKSYVDSKIAEAGGGAGTYQAVSLTEGQILIGNEGTEIILRSGEAAAIDNGENGVSDLTAGTELWSGNDVLVNHLLLIPRNDGRGIRAVTDIWLMVRGSYTIQ